MLDKPEPIFDRDDEWQDLARFAADERPGATLGVVTGRRRQGKTMLVGSGHVARLERVRELLRARSGLAAAGTRLLLASGAGFTTELAGSDRPDLLLVDLPRLYRA